MNRSARICRGNFETLESRRLLAGHAAELSLYVQDGYLPEVPILVRAQMELPNGEIDRSEWDQVVKLSTVEDDIQLSVQQIELTNGVGSALVTVSGDRDFSIRASIDEQTVDKGIRSFSQLPINKVSGMLKSEQEVWSQIVHIEDDVTIGAGQTLTIQPGTLLLFSGVPVTERQSIGSRLIVNGTLDVQGNETSPVTFTAIDSEQPWGEIDVEGGTANISFANINRAGNSRRGGHTRTGPALRLDDSASVHLNSVNVTDLRGKIMQADDSELTIRNSLFSRATMGPEIEDSSLLMDNTWLTEMAGVYHFAGEVDDNDGIYLHGQAEGQTIVVNNSVIAHTQDDGLDTLGARATVSNLLIRDIHDKAVSILKGSVDFDRLLISGADIGINAKGNGDDVVDVSVNRATIVDVETGIRAQDKDGPDPDVTINYTIENSIILADRPVRTDYDPDKIRINYSLLPIEWKRDGSGTGNLQGDPSFVDRQARRYQLTESSPAIDAGNPQHPLEADQTRVDLGYFSYSQQDTTSGDFNQDQIVDDQDIDLLCQAIQNEAEVDAAFDLNHDGEVDSSDMDELIENVLHSSIGDANLDGRFDSSDLVLIFQQGQYEDPVAENSTWRSGDWNCDREFNSSDLVAAFQAGTYVPG